MVTKHFFKALVVFSIMIVLGIIGVFIVDYLDRNGSEILKDFEVAK